MISWSVAIKQANLLEIAESVDSKADYSASDKAQIQAAGYTFVQQRYGDEPATSVNPHGRD